MKKKKNPESYKIISVEDIRPGMVIKGDYIFGLVISVKCLTKDVYEIQYHDAHDGYWGIGITKLKGSEYQLIEGPKEEEVIQNLRKDLLKRQLHVENDLQQIELIMTLKGIYPMNR